ncbi:hypothetical protein JCM10908_001384 [Rhodotorula pacifica]|uniref:uncharacterized protein n=1 Tax=Rhodotorula pacifica TaxID=1495444 RepID=UPI00317FB0EE
MDALSKPPASLEALRQRKALVDSHLALHDDLAARLDALLAARAQGNGRMDLPVDIGMGFTAKGVVHDTSRIIVSAGIQELFLDLPVEKAREFVEKKRQILQKRLEALEKPLAQAEAEHERVSKALKAAFEVPDHASPAVAA